MKKILFDEDVPRKLVRYLPHCECQTVVSMQWGGIKNGELLQWIEIKRFDVFLTGDKNIPGQQQLQGRPFAVLIMSAINWPVVQAYIPAVVTAIDEAEPGTVKHIDCGIFVPRSID